MMTQSEKAQQILGYLAEVKEEGLGPSELGQKMGFSYYEASATVSATLEKLVDQKFIEKFKRKGKSRYRLFDGDPMYDAETIGVDYITEYYRGQKHKYFMVTGKMKLNARNDYDSKWTLDRRFVIVTPMYPLLKPDGIPLLPRGEPSIEYSMSADRYMPDSKDAYIMVHYKCNNCGQYTNVEVKGTSVQCKHCNSSHILNDSI